jgi:hypothetical protein
MALLASENGALLGVFFLLVMIIGIAATIALWFFVMRHAPPDGSDSGRAPEPQPDVVRTSGGVEAGDARKHLHDRRGRRGECE